MKGKYSAFIVLYEQIYLILTLNLSILGNLYSNANAVTNVGANVTAPNIIDVVNVTTTSTTTTTTTTTTVKGIEVMTGNMQLNFLHFI